MTPMLTGYRVLDLTQFVAGPTCTRILAECGAEVIKLELAPAGDHGRRSGLKPRGAGLEDCTQSTYFVQHNHSKKSLAVDLKSERGRELIRAMIPKIDVLVENFAPGAVARMGLAWEDLKAINPKLVMCSISMAGQDGPLSGQPGFDYMAAAYAGVSAILGEEDRGPVQLPLAMGDSATGIAAAMAVGFALLNRERGGEGQHIDCSLLDTYIHMHEDSIPRVGLRGRAAVPRRSGPHHPNGGPTGVFDAGDGAHVQIMVMPYQWPRMVAALGMPELIDDPRFKGPRERRDNREALKAVIEGWMASLPGREAVLEALRRERVPCAPILTLDEVIAHPHMRGRGAIREAHDPHLGSFPVPGPPARFSGWTPSQAPEAPLLGADNAGILGDLLGLDDAEIERLYREHVLVADRRVRRAG